MPTAEELADAVAGARWAALAPPHRAGGSEQPRGAPHLLDALPLAGRDASAPPQSWLAVVADDAGGTYAVPLVRDADARVRRATPGDGAAAALVTALSRGGTSTGARAGAFALTAWRTDDAPARSLPAAERGLGVDQTNESVVLDGRAIVKWAHVVAAGPHPAPALLGALVDAGFSGVPAPWGVVQWHPGGGGAPRLLATVDAHLVGAVDGWTWAVDDLRAALTARHPGAVVASGACAGTLVADLHAALAPARRAATAAEVAAWATGGEADLDRALAVTDGDDHALLRRHETQLRDGIRPTAGLVGTPVMPVHGDLHLGQVLRTAGGYVVVDFDGNPVVAPAERLLPQPAALDVTGVVQSFAYAALVLCHHQRTADAARAAAAAAAGVGAFRSAYDARLGALGLTDLLEPALLRPFRLRAVCREFTYAATHLPRWSYAPRGALPALLAGS